MNRAPLLLLALLLLAAPIGAQRTGLSVDPALPTAGQPARILLGFQTSAVWCYYHRGEIETLPGELRVHFAVDLPLDFVPCEAPPPDLASFVWNVPTGVLTAGFWQVLGGSASGPDGFLVLERFGFTVLPASPRLVLHGGELFAELAFTDPRTGERRPATAVPLSSESGLFWFFSGDNVEVTVKLLDGRPVNGHWWFFIASQTSLPFEVVLTRRTSECALLDPPLPCPQRTYAFAGGRAVNRQDVLAFPE